MTPLADGSAGNPVTGSPSKSTVEPDDRPLALAARDGDRAAFTELVMRYSARLHAMLLHLCGGDAELAGELTQEAFVRAFDRLGQFQAQSSFYTWLYRLARNRALDLLQRRRPITGATTLAEVPSPAASPAERLGQQELVSAVQAALHRLPTEVRELLLLREFEGWDYERIAETLQVPLGTVKSRLARARMALRACLFGQVVAEDLV